MGKAGVGKSSLINYFFDADVALQSLGKPITPFGFHLYSGMVNEIDFNVFDSSGIEIKNHLQWLNLLDTEFANRGVNKPVFEWFHSIIYCLSCAGRLEDIDNDIIRQCVSKGYHLIVALTWADSISKEKISEYENIIYHSFNKSEVTVIPVCSVQSETFFGHVEKFGKDQLINSIIENFWSLIIRRLPQRISFLLNAKVDDWKKEQLSLVDQRLSGLIGYFVPNSTHREIEKNSQEFTKVMDTQIKEVVKQESILTFTVFNHFAKNFNVSPDLNSFQYKLDPKQVYQKEQRGNLAAGLLVTVLMGGVLEIFGFSKAFVSSSIGEDINNYVESLKEKINEIETKITDLLKNNLSIKFQKKEEILK